jgi:hypothetical protein
MDQLTGVYAREFLDRLQRAGAGREDQKLFAGYVLDLACLTLAKDDNDLLVRVGCCGGI